MISIGFSAPNITAAIFNAKDDSEFVASTSILKNQKFQWNPTLKVWTKPAVLYNDNLYDTLMLVTNVYFPAVIKEAIKNYPKTLPSELIVSDPIESIDYSRITKFPPITGKKPYENFQDEDIRKALSRNRFLFNWDTGCGKSFATAAIYGYLRLYKNVSKMIIITSRIGTYNLQKEMYKFCQNIELEDTVVFNSPRSFKKTGRKIFDIPEVCNRKILVFSYSSWKLITKAYGDKPKGKILNVPLDNFFDAGTDKLICLDECQYLSNPKSERSKAIFKYLRYFKYRYLFSATPADKNEKLYSVCSMLDPKLCRYLNYNAWINKYNDVGTWFSKYAINPKKWHLDELDELNRELADYSVKRLAAEVLDLPPLHIETISIDMSDKQKDMYKELTNEIVNHCLKKNPNLEAASVDIIHEAFSTVMSFCENPKILATSPTENVSDKFKEKCGKYNYSSDYAKLEVVDDILEDENENDQRGILWYIHPKTKEVVIERYAKYDPIVISAELSEEERDAALTEFKSNPKHKLLIASQNILATSVTLIECTFAIYLETVFAYETYLQSRGRIYRIGQKHNVRVYHIWLNKSTDLFHINAIENKGDLVNYLFSAKSKNPPKLSLEEIKQLFSGEL